MLFFDFGWSFGLVLIFGGWPKILFFLVPVPPGPVRCPVPPVPVPNRSGFRFTVRFASFLKESTPQPHMRGKRLYLAML